MSLIQKNTKNMLLVVIAINSHVLMIHLINKSFKSYLVEDAVYNFSNSMIEECKYCKDVMQKNFSKELIMTKNDNEDFKNPTKCWICDNGDIDGDVKVKYHCHATGKCRGPYKEIVI